MDDAVSHRCPQCSEQYEIQRQRLEQALQALKLRKWPYEGPAGIVEAGSGGKRAIHIIANWRYIGTARSAAELREMAQRLPRNPGFDVDTYKLATHALSTGKANLLTLSECAAVLACPPPTDVQD
jgi:hypothetical protein